MNWQKAVRGVHVTAPHVHRGKVLEKLRQMWSPTRKRNFPLNRKYTVVPNGSDPSMMVGSAARRDLAALRRRQGKMLKDLMVMDLVDTIKDPSLPVYGGGPSLTDHLVGMYHPTEDRPLFKSVD